MSVDKEPTKDFSELYITTANSGEAPEGGDSSLKNVFLQLIENEELIPADRADYSYKDFKDDMKKFLIEHEGELSGIEKYGLNNREAKSLFAFIELYNKARKLDLGGQSIDELESLLNDMEEFKLMHPGDISPMVAELITEVAMAIVKLAFSHFASEAENGVLDKSSYQIFLAKVKDLFPDKEEKIDEWDDKVRILLN